MLALSKATEPGHGHELGHSSSPEHAQRPRTSRSLYLQRARGGGSDEDEDGHSTPGKFVRPRSETPIERAVSEAPSVGAAWAPLDCSCMEGNPVPPAPAPAATTTAATATTTHALGE